jgi:hypothetical protein
MIKVKSLRNPFSRSRAKSKGTHKKNGNGNGHAKRSDFNKMLFEALEPRLLMSSDLSYTSIAAFDLTLRYDTPSQKLQLIDNQSATAVAEQDLSQTERVVITGSAQDDRLTIDFSTLSDNFDFSSLILFDGGTGSDTFKAG